MYRLRFAKVGGSFCLVVVVFIIIIFIIIVSLIALVVPLIVPQIRSKGCIDLVPTTSVDMGVDCASGELRPTSPAPMLSATTGDVVAPVRFLDGHAAAWAISGVETLSSLDVATAFTPKVARRRRTLLSADLLHPLSRSHAFSTPPIVPSRIVPVHRPLPNEFTSLAVVTNKDLWGG